MDPVSMQTDDEPKTGAGGASTEAEGPKKKKRLRTTSGKRAEGCSAPRGQLLTRSRGVRRPYRGLAEDTLKARLDVLQRREEALRVKHDRAAGTLSRLRVEQSMRAASVVVEPAC